MGREIRMVSPNWEHPTQECPHTRKCRPCYAPLSDQSFAEAAREWKEGFAAWERGERPAHCRDEPPDTEYWEYEGAPPQREDGYRPDWKPEERTWFQVYETVSEGTPVTPPFATRERLIDYLVKNGDYWDQHRGAGGWKREHAESFVSCGWAPSAMSFMEGDAVVILEPRDGNGPRP